MCLYVLTLETLVRFHCFFTSTLQQPIYLHGPLGSNLKVHWTVW